MAVRNLAGQKKFANTVWNWIGEQMDITNWFSRLSQYDKEWDYYKGRQWEHETKKYRESFIWKPVYNEIGASIDEHVALMLSARLRHYHINIDYNMKEAVGLNAFLVRNSAANMHYTRRDALMYGLIYGAANISFSMDVMDRPAGYIGKTRDDTSIPMPRYFAEPPWQWIWDAAGDGDWRNSHWAIRFFSASKNQSERNAGRPIEDISVDQYALLSRFRGRTVAMHSMSTSEAITSANRDDLIVGADIWLRETPVYDAVKSEPSWRHLRVIGDWPVWGMIDDPRYLMPYGQECGIPASIYSPRPMPKYVYGQSFINRAMSIQKDVNARRARAREIEQVMAGILLVRGREQDAALVRNQRASGVVNVPSNVSVERLRGEKSDTAMYMEIRGSLNEFRQLLGVPPVSLGESASGVYSGQHAELLQKAAGVMTGWKNNEFGNAMKVLGDKEWSALKYMWEDKGRIQFDIGPYITMIDVEIMNYPGWSAEAVPEDLYARMIASDNEQVISAFMQGMIDMETFYKHLPFLTDEERDRSMQFMQSRMNAMAAQPAGAATAEQ